jgi:SpoVK/Ycf46/Vps4 family AAA+-type ATPase
MWKEGQPVLLCSLIKTKKNYNEPILPKGDLQTFKMPESGDSDHDYDFFDSMGGLQTMGILNALKTGDTRLDMFLAMCIPFVIRFLFDAVGRLEQFCHYDYWHKWWNSRDNMHHRSISYRSTRNPWGGSSSLDPDSQNTVLLKAIQLYLHSKVNLNLTAADLNLTSTEDKHSSLGGYSSYDCDSDDEDSDGRTVVGILSKYKIIKNPPSDDWHQLGSYGELASASVELRIENHDVASGDGKQKENLRIFNFRSPQGRAIDAFVETAFDWYMNELRKLEDNSRYLYELKSTSAGIGSNDDNDGENTSGSRYTRYRLSDEKTFDSLFFREKEPLLNLIDNFRNRSGRYKVKGYPHKLGVLLHGPPGSGKTSLIKALAQHTGRSIVNVPLARISTNAELQSIFFDRTYHVQGQCVPVKLGYKDIIFVMEDVDAASKVVKRRDGKNTTGTQIDDVELPLPKSMWQMLVESSESDCVELVKTLIEKSERLKEEALKPEVLQSIAKRVMVLPGLGLVREAGDHPALRKIGDEAVEYAQIIMAQYSAVDSFVNVHACAIAKLLESGAMVDDAFLEALLSNEGPPSPPLLPRDISFSKYGGNEDTQIETDNQYSALLLHRPSSFEQVSDSAKNAKSSSGKATAGLDVMGPSLWTKAGMDQLNLTGILNVLDGVVDTPGRIVIMTTNHPEMLDPALIRPGRIDKKLYLGYMAALDVIEMLEHYFQLTLDAEQRVRVEKVIAGRLNVTPAQVEQLTAEYENVEDMILVLEEKGQPPVSSSTARFDLSPKSVIE